MSCIQTGITATGTSGATAVVLTGKYIDVKTVTGSNNGVILTDSPIPNMEITVRNSGGGTALQVYPPSGGKINNLATDAAFSLSVNNVRLFATNDGTNWLTFVPK